MRVTCHYCKRSHGYYPDDLIQIFGDIDVDSLMGRMRCEAGDHGPMDVRGFVPTGSEAVGLRIRRLVALKIRRVSVWRDGGRPSSRIVSDNAVDKQLPLRKTEQRKPWKTDRIELRPEAGARVTGNRSRTDEDY